MVSRNRRTNIAWLTLTCLAAFLAYATTIAACLGCAAPAASTVLRDATVSANASATTLETLQGVALIVYRTEQEIALQAAINAGETHAQAAARIATVRAAWQPVLDAFAVARATYAALSAVLTATAQPADGVVQSAVTANDAAVAKATAALATARLRVQGGVQ